MKNIFLILTTLACWALPHIGLAQEGQTRKEKIESMKIAFINQELSLTPKEAQAFWPYYNQHMDKLEVLRQNRKRDAVKPMERLNELTDAELQKVIDAELNFKSQEAALAREYYEKYKTVLPLKKVALLYKAEEEFKRELLKKLKEQKP